MEIFRSPQMASTWVSAVVEFPLAWKFTRRFDQPMNLSKLKVEQAAIGRLNVIRSIYIAKSGQPHSYGETQNLPCQILGKVSKFCNSRSREHPKVPPFA